MFFTMSSSNHVILIKFYVLGGNVENVLNLMGTIEQKKWLVAAGLRAIVLLFICSYKILYGAILDLERLALAECLKGGLQNFCGRGKSAKNTEQ